MSEDTTNTELNALGADQNNTAQDPTFSFLPQEEPTPPQAPEIPQDLPIPQDRVPEWSFQNVFPSSPIQEQPKGTVTVDAAAFERIMKVVERAERNGEVVDLNNIANKKKIIRIPIYRDTKWEEHIVTGYTTKEFRDGTRTNTWQEGLDPMTKQPISWCEPILVNLKTGVTTTEVIQYMEFINVLIVIPLEVKHEDTQRIEMTTQTEIIDVVSYQETGMNGRISAVPTGQRVKASVWWVTTKVTVEYEGKDYIIDETVFNIK